jgi:hypothetical protein
MAIITVALIARIIVWLCIPLDWNWDSYHHWQIAYLSLKIGFLKGRLWDLNGCEYYWAIFPHLIQSLLQFLTGQKALISLRIFNALLGSINSGLVFLISRKYISQRSGIYAGIGYAIFPIAAIFDILALQDTIALTFLIASLYLLEFKPFWSGFFLALAGQSRTELYLVGFLITMGYLLSVRFTTDKLPFLISYSFINGIFGWFLFNKTGNPFYNIYWSLYNVFGGWQIEEASISFWGLMIDWILWKLSVWIRKPTGLLILISGLFLIIIYINILKGRGNENYFPLYFLSTFLILSPIFLPYIGSDHSSFLIMLRMINPITAIGLPIITGMNFQKGTNIISRCLSKIHLEKIILILFIFGYPLLIPYYSDYQSHTISAFNTAEIAWEEYTNGTIVCDYPTMNYWFTVHGGISPCNLLGNHYSPHYYGSTESMDYLHWFEKNDVKLWIYYDSRASPVWRAVECYPDIFFELEGGSAARIYKVNRTEIRRILG